MRAFVLCALVGVVGVGCNPNSIGRPCVNPTNTAPLGTQISSPALECPSRLCLIHPTNGIGGVDGGDSMNARSTCTASCQDNSDCDAETRSQCADSSGKTYPYVCAVAVTAGDFCCKKLCICKLDLDPGVNFDPTTNKIVTPASCKYDPQTNPFPTCRNVHH